MQKILVLRLPDVPVFLQSSMVMLPPARRGMPDVLEIMFAVLLLFAFTLSIVDGREWRGSFAFWRDCNVNAQKFTCSSLLFNTMTTTVNLISHSKSAQKIRWPASK